MSWHAPEEMHRGSWGTLGDETLGRSGQIWHGNTSIQQGWRNSLILPACHSFLRFSYLLPLPSRRGKLVERRSMATSSIECLQQLKNSSHDFQQYDATQYYLPSQGFEAIPDHLTGGQDGRLSTHLRIISTMRTADHQAYGLKHTIPAILNAERKG